MNPTTLSACMFENAWVSSPPIESPITHDTALTNPGHMCTHATDTHIDYHHRFYHNIDSSHQQYIHHRPWLTEKSSMYDSMTSFQNGASSPPTCTSYEFDGNFLPNFHMLSLSARISKLNKTFLSMNLTSCKDEVDTIQQIYHEQSRNIESQRMHQLQGVACFEPWISESINAYYDNLHHNLINRVLQRVNIQLESITTKTSSSSEKQREPTITVSDQQPNDTQNQQMSKDSISSTDVATSHHRVYKRLYKRKGTLDPVAIRIMTAWYNNNSEHPYPSYDAAQIMASAGNITVDQVKKWFANRRRRTNNTKTMKEIAERRKVIKRTRACLESDDLLLSDAKRARDC